MLHQCKSHINYTHINKNREGVLICLVRMWLTKHHKLLLRMQFHKLIPAFPRSRFTDEWSDVTLCELCRRCFNTHTHSGCSCMSEVHQVNGESKQTLVYHTQHGLRTPQVLMGGDNNIHGWICEAETSLVLLNTHEESMNVRWSSSRVKEVTVW